MNLNFSYSEAEKLRANIQRTRKIKYSRQNLPQDWLNSDCVISEIDRVIRNLEESDCTQDNIDHIYVRDLCCSSQNGNVSNITVKNRTYRWIK